MAVMQSTEEGNAQSAGSRELAGEARPRDFLEKRKMDYKRR